MIRMITAGLLVAAFAAAPAFAAETCDQALKDTATAFKTSTIGPQATSQADALIKEAQEVCKAGDPERQAQGVELLRIARMMIGE